MSFFIQIDGGKKINYKISYNCQKINICTKKKKERKKLHHFWRKTNASISKRSLNIFDIRSKIQQKLSCLNKVDVYIFKTFCMQMNLSIRSLEKILILHIKKFVVGIIIGLSKGSIWCCMVVDCQIEEIHNVINKWDFWAMSEHECNSIKF